MPFPLSCTLSAPSVCHTGQVPLFIISLCAGGVVVLRCTKVHQDSLSKMRHGSRTDIIQTLLDVKREAQGTFLVLTAQVFHLLQQISAQVSCVSEMLLRGEWRVLWHKLSKSFVVCAHLNSKGSNSQYGNYFASGLSIKAKTKMVSRDMLSAPPTFAAYNRNCTSWVMSQLISFWSMDEFHIMG